MEQRPNPDALLARVRADAAREQRGKLKIFFGASAGVGKTYAMLEAAHLRRAEGVDVVAGVVVTHGRTETEALLNGLEILPAQRVAYRGTTLEEFDLDAALARRPQLILVDELAHTNAPGVRHPKRWQDVLEILDAGIDVYTTVNVQHLESLNDVVAQITGVVVRETVPDSVLEQADAVELIDLTPEDLRRRLAEGKVYVPQQAERAARSFFRPGNLHALRELALRCTADRVDAAMQDYRRDNAIRDPWPTTERLLVGIGPNPQAGRLIRAARRMAARLRAPWIVVYVETPAQLRLPESARDAVVQNLRLAESLGAETVTLSGDRASTVLLDYARQRNVSKIVVGKPENPRWREMLFGSVVDEVVRGSGQIDVYVISGDFGDTEPQGSATFAWTSPRSAYLWAALVAAGCTGLAALAYPYFSVSDLAMIYLPGVVLVANRFGRGPSILASILSVSGLNFFFTQPYFTLFVEDPRIVLTLVVLLLVALVISTLTARTRRQAHVAIQRERRTSALYALSRDYASTRGRENLLLAAVRHIGTIFEGHILIFLPDAMGHLSPWGGLEIRATEEMRALPAAPNSDEAAVARWAFEHGEPAGVGTNTLPGADGLYLPLRGTQELIGVLGLYAEPPRRVLGPEQLHLLETFTSQTALALERASLAQTAQQAAVQVESERTRNALLSSVSHDLRTPMAVVSGALSSVIDGWRSLPEPTRLDLLHNAYDEAERLNRLLANLLEMTRLEAGGIQARKEWQPLDEVVGAALSRLESRLAERPIAIDLPPDLPLVPLDTVLIEQVLVNLLENALKYTPPRSPLTIAAATERDAEGRQAVRVSIADRGPGLGAGTAERIFEKFDRGAQPVGGGAGLGLTISRGMVQAHGGRIYAENRVDGGAIFAFTLPLDGEPPVVAEDLPVEAAPMRQPS
ncbi:MAG: sensor histidine kinase KdpD [Blastochloris sp.]|nr:sensor histidine kinase KdpD [Blastochloris sp.]